MGVQALTEASDPLELALQLAVGHRMWALGMEPRASAKAVCAFNLWSHFSNHCH